MMDVVSDDQNYLFHFVFNELEGSLDFLLVGLLRETLSLELNSFA
jgi:hypothetical protein